MTVEDLFRKIGAQTMEIDMLKNEIERLKSIISAAQTAPDAEALATDKSEAKKTK
jgi:hypothetical protein